MKKSERHRSFVALAATTIFAMLISVAAAGQSATSVASPQVQPLISVSPDTVETGASATVTIDSAGFFDLSQVDATRIGIRPNDGVSNLQIVAQTAQHLTLSFDLADTASPGTRTLFINDKNGAPQVALDLAFKQGANVCIPNCVSPNICRDNACVSPPPPNVCHPDCGPNARCEGGRCVDLCTPHCVAPLLCDGSTNQCVRRLP